VLTYNTEHDKNYFNIEHTHTLYTVQTCVNTRYTDISSQCKASCREDQMFLLSVQCYIHAHNIKWVVSKMNYLAYCPNTLSCCTNRSFSKDKNRFGLSTIHLFVNNVDKHSENVLRYTLSRCGIMCTWHVNMNVCMCMYVCTYICISCLCKQVPFSLSPFLSNLMAPYV